MSEHRPLPSAPRRDPDDPAGIIRAEVVGAGALVAAMVAALLWANLAPSGSYDHFWTSPLEQALGSWIGTADSGFATVRDWVGITTCRDVVDSLLLTVFFLAVGLEVGRERREGALADTRRAVLPVAAALGGMAGAALTYLLVVTVAGGGAAGRHGWGVPMATDVAFTLAAIALLGRRVPSGVRTFVLALAVADDVASVVVLAVVSSSRIRILLIVLAAVVLLATATLLRRVAPAAWWPYLLALALTWVLLARGGVEPPLAGAFVGMLVPCAPCLDPRTHRLPRPSASARLERVALPLSTWVVLPLFALANTGVTLRAGLLQDQRTASIVGAVVAARIVGKIVGITGVTAILVWRGLSRLPDGARWAHIVGIGALCGMGFTVPILFAEAAYPGQVALSSAAELGLLVGTVVAGVVGTVLLARAGRPRGIPVTAALGSRRADRAPALPVRSVDRPGPEGPADEPEEGPCVPS